MSSQVARLFPTLTLLAALQGKWAYHWPCLVNLPVRAFQIIRGSLQAKFILIIVALQIAVMGAVAAVMEHYQRQAIIEQAQLRALSLAMSLAALAEGYLLGYNYIKLEQAVEKVAADEPDIAYAVAQLYDGRVAAFSWRDDLQGKMLDDAVSQHALQATQPLVQSIVLPETQDPGYDVAIPVFISGSPKKWGTIRVGFSLQRAYALIQQTRRALLWLSLGAVVGGTSLAIFLAMRISQPIEQLVEGVNAVAKGLYDRPIRVETEDEIGYLAHAFEEMRSSLQHHLASLADEKRRLEEANRCLQETQQQLIQSERLAAVGQVAARVAHEVNNPLAIIKTAIGVINRRHREHNPAAEHLQMIEEEIDRIARIIDELREFSRPAPAREVVHVNHIIQSLEGLVESNLHERRIVLRIVLEPHVPPVCIAADQLKQVILNMVRNAIDAMPQGGELAIRTARKGTFVELSITDTGSGIAPEHRGRLFDPFFTTKGKERGMGLGLSVSFDIIREANGRIEVESVVGKGSTFRVSLPVYGDRQEEG
jgi:two-component system, NtrC family, sensor kinase